MMGCGVYPQDKYFKSLIKEEVEYIVPKLRNHPCICLWAGDNENDVAAFYWRPDLRVSPNANTLTRKLIPSLLKK